MSGCYLQRGAERYPEFASDGNVSREGARGENGAVSGARGSARALSPGSSKQYSTVITRAQGSAHRLKAVTVILRLPPPIVQNVNTSSFTRVIKVLAFV